MKLRIPTLAALTLLVLVPVAYAHEGTADTQETSMRHLDQGASTGPVVLDEVTCSASGKQNLADILFNDILDSGRPMAHCSGGGSHCSSQEECELGCGGPGRCVLTSGCCVCM